MKTNPKISIIIPVYNGSNYLKEAIESALAQTYKNIEIIVVNDGSNDQGKTEKIALNFGRKIRYYKKKNGGVASALNFGIRKMQGEYFSWLSHDDVYFPEKLQKEIDFIQKCPPKTLVYSNFEVIDQFGQHAFFKKLKSIRKLEFMYFLVKKRFIQGCTLLVPKSVFVAEGVFDEKLRNTQDYDLWFRLIAKGYSFRLCPDILVKSRQHNEQTSITTSCNQTIEEESLYSRVLNQFSPRQLIFPEENLGLGYLKFAISFQILGLSKAANSAFVLSRKYLSKKDYFIWFVYFLYYLFWRFLFFRIVHSLVPIVHKLKRTFRPYLNKKNQIKKISNSDRIHFCLIGNISSPHNQKLVNFLKQKNYEIHFISTHKGRILGIKNYDLSRRRLEPKFWWFIRAIFSSRKLIKKINPNLVQGQYLAHGGIFAYLSGFRPYIVGIWGTEVLEFEQFGILKYLIKKTLLNATLMIGSSYVLKEAAVSIGADSTKFHLVRFGVDLDIFRHASSQYLRQKMGLKNDKVIFSPRAIDIIYNTKILVEAFELIAQKGKFKLALLDQPFNQFYSKEIKDYIINHQLENKIVFLPPVENSKMADYYNLAEVVVSIPKSDSAAVSFLEAMACEKKIVVSDLPFLKEWQNSHSFWRSKIEVNALSKTLIQALNYPSNKFKPIGLSNRELVRQKADLKTCFNELDSIYYQIIKNI